MASLQAIGDERLRRQSTDERVNWQPIRFAVSGSDGVYYFCLSPPGPPYLFREPMFIRNLSIQNRINPIPLESPRTPWSYSGGISY